MISDPVIVEANFQVSTRLSTAWEFLSGARRSFSLRASVVSADVSAEFTFLLPLAVSGRDGSSAIAVLIDRADALAVAMHMFDVGADRIEDNDVRDACAEVCNIFSDCIVMHIGGESDVSIGLPMRVDGDRFVAINAASVLSALYQSCEAGQTLSVLVYDHFCETS